MNSFTLWDYLVFFGILGFSIAIGIFFAVKGRKTKTEGEYLMAGRSMSVIPVAVSITASFVSAISILGNPAEMYTQGATFMLNTMGLAGGSLVSAIVFVPLLYPLQLTSCFEYLERRFKSRYVRLIGTATTIVTNVVYMAVASFAPATAFKVVTGFPVWATLIIMMATCTFYTTIGGMKAVIWTDTFQSGVMMAGVMAIIVQASIKIGGFSQIWSINDEWGRLDVWNFNPDPTVRHTFWSFSIGWTLVWVHNFGLSQASVQRYCSLPTLKQAKLTILSVILCCNLIVLACSVSGLAIFAYYAKKDCDPVGKKLIEHPNQIVPFFVMEALAYPCVPGIFFSSLFSAALSTVSSSLNSLAAVTWEDILKPLLAKRMWDNSRRLAVIKSTVVAYGFLALCVSFIVKDLEGTILQVSITLTSAAIGPTTGMFILGAFFPWANAKGVIAGSLLSLALCFWVTIGGYVTGIPHDKVTYPNGSCSEYLSTINDTTMDAMTPALFTGVSTATPSLFSISMVLPQDVGNSLNEERTGLKRLYSLSYLWYTGFGIITTVILGLIFSFIAGANSMDDVPTEYQIPLASRVLCCLPKSWQRKLNCHRRFDDPEVINEKMLSQDMFKNGCSDSKGMHEDGKEDFDALRVNANDSIINQTIF